MNIVLVSPPTVTDFEDRDVLENDAVLAMAEHAPLGVLTLAAVLESHALAPSMVDLNQLFLSFIRDPPSRVDFAEYVAERLVALAPDVLGLGTICSSYPLVLRVAGHVKRLRPSTLVVLGGPQASVTDVPTLEAFPAVDYVVRGEAEQTLPQLLAALSGRGSLEFTNGITFRQSGKVRRQPAAPPTENLDALPLPAFHLSPPAFGSGSASLELGRGCPFACKFCSTNDFFRRNFRLKSPAAVLGQMREVHRQYGIGNFDLVHDMFTVDRRRVQAFCEHLIEAGEGFTWGCSARTDCIDEELIELMASAGCRGIFFGIETGSARMQKLINKHLDLDKARQMIAVTSAYHIQTAVSLITGFPEEKEDDLRASVDFVLDSLRFESAFPQFHLLAPLVETPMFTEFRDSLVLDEIASDMSHQGWRQNEADRALIKAHKDIFGNFFTVPTELARERLSELSDFLIHGTARLRWLLVALHQHSGNLLAIFDSWRQWRVSVRKGNEIYEDRKKFYSSFNFADAFLDFVQNVYLTGDPQPVSVRAIVDYERSVLDLLLQADRRREAGKAEPASTGQDGQFSVTDVPMLAGGVHLFHLKLDHRDVIRRLKECLPVDELAVEKITMVLRMRSDGKEINVLRLSDLSSKILGRCTGDASIRSIAVSLEPDRELFEDAPLEESCLFGLEMLRAQGLVTAAPRLAE